MKSHALQALRSLFGKIGRRLMLAYFLWCLVPETISIVLVTIYWEGPLPARMFTGFLFGIPATLAVAAISFCIFRTIDEWLALPESKKCLQGKITVWAQYDMNDGSAGRYYSVSFCGIEYVDDETAEVVNETVEPAGWGMDLNTFKSMLPVGTAVPVTVLKGPSGQKYAHPEVQALIDARRAAFAHRFTMSEA